MTRIDFYTKVDNKLRFAGKLCAKVLGQKLRVNVYAPDPALAERFDRLLWTDSALSFIPHCRADDPLAAETPVVIHTRPGEVTGELLDDALLINLDQAWPPFFSRFERVIEIVGTEPDDAAAARERFRFYRDRGYAMQTHDMSVKA